MAEAKFKPVVSRYEKQQTRRYEHGRDVKQTDLEWQTEKEFKLPSVDDAIAEQIELALARGDTQIVVLDIGCGSGGLFEDSVQNFKQLQKSTALLQAHPEFKIRFTGLTDAKKTEDFLTHTTVFNRAAPNLTAEIYAYTLTAQQTIEHFLQQVGIEQAELILATWSLAYMGENTFIKVLEDSLKTLRSGGKMIVNGFINKHPGFTVSHAIPMLNPKEKNEDNDEWKKNLKSIMRGEFWTKQISLPKFLQVLSEVEQHLAHLPEFDAEYFAKKSEILSAKTLTDFTKKVLLGRSSFSREVNWVRSRLESLFNAKIQQLGWRKITEISSNKLDALKTFIEKKSDAIGAVQHSPDSILLQKK